MIKVTSTSKQLENKDYLDYSISRYMIVVLRYLQYTRIEIKLHQNDFITLKDAV